MPPRWATIIVAAGNGQRFGGACPKQYAPLAGKPVLAHSLARFAPLGEIALVVDPAHEAYYTPLLAEFPGILIVPGGTTRQQSVREGLRALQPKKPTHILIHDAARPLVDAAAIMRLTSALEKGAPAATLALPIVDTLMRGTETLDRTGVHAIQTPQGFAFNLALDAHEHAGEQNFTDDASLVQHIAGIAPAIVEGHADNFKITGTEDLARAERVILAAHGETRTGIGFDVHQFGEAPANGTIKLFGTDIPNARKLVGHSDADAGLHAIADAILGTIGAGDIGVLFPPSDMQWKGMDSAVIVKEALRRLHEKNGILIHIDIMLVSEEPKIGKHRDAIIARLMQILHLPAENIGLKATTNEKMGFIGRGEGLVVQALATVKVRR